MKVYVTNCKFSKVYVLCIKIFNDLIIMEDYSTNRKFFEVFYKNSNVLSRASLRIRFSNSKICIEKNQNSKFIRITNNFELIRIIFFELFRSYSKKLIRINLKLSGRGFIQISQLRIKFE